MEVVTAIVGKIFDCSLDATWRQFGYLYRYKDTIKRLTDEAKKLEGTRERVQAKIDEAKTKGEIILSDVTNWLQRVDEITEEAERFTEDEDQANKRCLKGLCIDPRSRYRFGKEAQRKIEAISILYEEGAKFEVVSRQAPPPGIIFSSALCVNFKSRELITRQIMEMLKDENVSIIGICGMGGVGKTTLANEISKQAFEKKLFDFVVTVVVSQTQNYVNIQGEIAKRLGFKLPDDYCVSVRANFLSQRIMHLKIEQEPEPKPKPNPEREQEPKPKLKPKPKPKPKQMRKARILIVLDDVREGIELGSVGISSTSRHCKIVLTSRIEDVCKEMKAKTFKVGTLPKGESWRLFREVAGEIVDNPDINPIAREVADECDGLPLAIVTVAGALKNRNDKYVWIDAKQQLEKSAPTIIRGMDQKVFARLEWSYKFLESEQLKSVFLLCCLFPEDFNIPIELLMKYGMGLRLFQEVDTVEEARGRTHSVVSALTSCFLLITGYDEKHVKMHDVVRDFAIKLSKDDCKFMAKAGLGLQACPSEDTYENLTRISLMYNDLREVPDGLEYPKLQALLLQQNPSLVVSNDFFQGMEDLKVLDMSGIRKLQLPQSLVLPANLRMLCLDYCKFGEEADISFIGKLTNLEILSLNGTDIQEIPGNFGQLVKLRLFDLTECSNLRQIPQAVILCLKKLEELYVSNSHSNEGMLIQFQALSRQTILLLPTQEQEESELVNSLLCRIMTFQNSIRFSITIGNGNINPLEKYRPWSRFMYISDISYPKVGWTYELMKITEELQLCKIVGLRNILPDLGNHGFNGLKCLELNDCRETTYLLNTFECTPPHLGSVAFNSLEYLRMEHIPNLVEICHGPLPAESFCKVKGIHISYCHNMLNIAPSNLLQRLQSLESLEACNCDSVVYAFDFEGLVIARQPNFLSSLNYLRLVGLPELTQIWNGDAKLISLRNLVFIKISGCHKLKNLFTPSIVKGLVQLRTLEVKFCSTLEEIISDEKADTGGSMDRITFPGLYQIDLGKLDSLTCFCARRCTIEFPALELLDIQNCPKMETFGRGHQAVTPKLVNMINLECEKRWKDNLNITLQQFFKEKQERMQCSQDTDSDSDSGDLPEITTLPL